MPGQVKTRPWVQVMLLEEIPTRMERTVARRPPHAEYVMRCCQGASKPMPAAA